MRYAGLETNDMANGKGVCVSFWTQGCPHKCPGCHNPETWSFDGGLPLPNDIRGQIIKAISANGITRNFSILGGEPLCEQNLPLTQEIVSAVRMAYPQIKIYLWTGYLLEDLTECQKSILDKIDVLIDGPYIEKNRDITLALRGSSNQRVLYKEIDF